MDDKKRLNVEKIVNSLSQDLISDDVATYELDNGRIIAIYRLHYGIARQRYFRLELICSIDEWDIFYSKILNEVLYSFSIHSISSEEFDSAVELMLTMNEHIKQLERI